MVQADTAFEFMKPVVFPSIIIGVVVGLRVRLPSNHNDRPATKVIPEDPNSSDSNVSIFMLFQLRLWDNTLEPD